MLRLQLKGQFQHFLCMIGFSSAFKCFIIGSENLIHMKKALSWTAIQQRAIR